MHTNRLAHEKSPYLLQHAHNPVDWYPWGPEAFEKAKREKKPIFLSIGYSTCHWCHVMERESFENQQIAALLGWGADVRLAGSGSGTLLRRHLLPAGEPVRPSRFRVGPYSGVERLAY